MLSRILPLIVLLVVWIGVARQGSRLLHVIERSCRRIAVRPIVCVVLVGLIGFAASAGLTWWGGWPPPRIHDEFSNLLLADTLAHGRLSNPSHPFWVHFESIHIIHQPTYASKYPPGQGAVLAAGQVFFGQPIIGVWLVTALACSATCWMLRAWLRPGWALLGGIVAALHPTLLAWSQGYWGGSLAVLGGALLLGAVRRMATGPRVRDSFLAALGIAILANTRPFEGMILCLVTLVVLVPRLFGPERVAFRVLLGRILAPLGLVLTLTAAGMGYYNWRVTGTALRMPYQVHEATYGVAPLFLWQTPNAEPAYRHRELRDFQVGWTLHTYEEQCSIKGVLSGALAKTATWFHSALPLLALQLSLLALPWLRRDPWMRQAFWMIVLFQAALLCETWTHAHYAAPIASLVLAVILQGMRRIWLCRWQAKSLGRVLVRASLLISLASLFPFCFELTQINRRGWHVQRDHILRHLTEADGRHLIVVHYGIHHSPHEEWVYNEADIDTAKVVWARDMGPEENQGLINYFKDRLIWRLEADEETPRLRRYAEEATR
jgi:hypothetical protein